MIRPGRVGGGAGDPQPPGRRHRDAGDDPLARLLRRDQGREPGGRGLRARDADARAAGRGRRAGRPDRRGRRRRGARAAPRRARRRRRIRSSRGRPVPRSTRCCSAAPTTRCSRGDHRRRWSGSTSRSSTRRRRPRRRWPSCSTINGLEAPTTRLRRADRQPSPADDRRPALRSTPSPAGCSGRRSPTSRRSSSRVAAR